jgi:iron(III) transport system substrate-binding protein
VWWGNEVFRTIRLADAGVLAPYDSPSAADIPPLFKDPNHLWGGNALRARVIGVRAEDAGGVEMIEDLIQPKWKGRVAIANPRAGTTSGHVAALYVLWGEPKAQAFFRGLRDNGVKVLGGNGDVASELAKGTIRVGLTDNDDLENVAREGAAVRMVLPDQKSYGTLTIPCTAALVAGAKHPEGAKKLIDHLLSAEVERQLIEAKFARYSVRAGATDPVKSIQVDYREVAKVLPKASNDAHAILVGRE